MRKTLFIIISLILSQLLIAQKGVIKGHIQDNNENEGLAFATVFLVNSNIGIHSDVNGNFVFDSIPIGIYDLKISYPLYRDTVLTSIIVTKDTLIELNINYPPPCKYKQKKSNCPICRKKNKVIPIVYGLPSKGLLKMAKKGKVRLGGCIMFGCDPHWYCKRDKKEF